MLKLHGENVQTEIPAYDLLEGYVAVITQWEPSAHVGKIVQRYGMGLVALGCRREDSWPEFFNCHNCRTDTDKHLRVRILPKGTTLILE
jgi:hypothetical protein